MISFILRLLPQPLRDHSSGKLLAGALISILLGYICGLVFIYPLERETFKTVADFTWFFFVSGFTVGYGDLFPKTDVGKMFTVIFCFFFTIGGFAVFATTLVSIIFESKNAALRGIKSFTSMQNHTIILGHDVTTQKLLEGILSDTNAGDIIIVCDTIEHPLPTMATRVKFVRGIITDNNTLIKAGIQGAKRVVIHGMSDEQTLMATLAVRANNANCYVVAEVDNEANLQHFTRIPGRAIECATNLQTSIAALAVCDPGVTITLNDLIGDGGDANLYVLPTGNSSQTYAQIAVALEKRGAKALGFQINGKNHLLPDAMTSMTRMTNAYVSYVAKNRIQI